jgi:tetratricopeptide (TPR) repeat protein
MTTLAFLTCYLLLQVGGFTPEVIEHAQAGAAALKDGRLDVAIQEFRKVTELQPDSASGHANLGEAYFQKSDYGAAVPELQRALQINANLMGAHQTLGVALLVQGDPEGALPHLEKTRNPALLGLAYLQTGRLGSAIMALQAALDAQPKDPDLLYYFGRATALASKRTSEQLAKANPDLASKNGGAADSESRPQDVVALEQALAKQPNDSGLLLSFSRAAAAASRQAFDQVLQSSADSARAHQVLAERAAGSGRLSDAEREYAESLRLKPYTSNVHLALGDILAAEGNWPAAVTQYRMESKLRPASADASYSLGAALLRQGQASGAVQELTVADRLRPDTPQILLALGKAEFAANDAGRAEASWIKLLGIDKTSGVAAAAHLELSTLYRRAGKVQEADREAAAYEQLRGQGGR